MPILRSQISYAVVVELVDTHDSKSCGEIHVGSIPTDGTNKKTHLYAFFYMNNITHRIDIYSIANKAKIRYTRPRYIRRKETLFSHLFLLIYY